MLILRSVSASHVHEDLFVPCIVSPSEVQSPGYPDHGAGFLYHCAVIDTDYSFLLFVRPELDATLIVHPL